jgi:hypothetical protein
LSQHPFTFNWLSVSPALAGTSAGTLARSLAFSAPAGTLTWLSGALSTAAGAAASAGTRAFPVWSCFIASWHCSHLLLLVQKNRPALAPSLTAAASGHGKNRDNLRAFRIRCQHVFDISPDKGNQLNAPGFDHGGGQLRDRPADQDRDIHLFQHFGKPFLIFTFYKPKQVVYF